MIERIELIDLTELQTPIQDNVRLELVPDRASEAKLDHGVDHTFAGFGEGLVMDERLVVSPCEGALRDRRAREGEYVCAGDEVARVVGPDGQSVPVHTPFAGWVMGFLVPHGSPVRRREPVLWLRSH